MDLQPDALFLRDRKQVVDDLKSRLRRIPVHAGNVGKKIEGAGRVTLQEGAGLAEIVPPDEDRHLVTVELYLLHHLCVPRQQARQRRMVLQLLQISDRGC